MLKSATEQEMQYAGLIRWLTLTMISWQRLTGLCKLYRFCGSDLWMLVKYSLEARPKQDIGIMTLS
jgi:hypothetical protein